MAEIKALKAWRYHDRLIPKIESLTSPLFDVVSNEQRQTLYQNAYNSIHLSVPAGDNPVQTAIQTLLQWKNENVIVQDPVPGIYVYYQHFVLPGSKEFFCRKGFMCNIKAYDWDEDVVLRHENTIPKAVDKRVELLKGLQLNASPTHGLYSDPQFLLESYMDDSMRNPILETEDYQGVRDVMSVIQDPEIIQEFVNTIESLQIILADGHHRYQGSINYRAAMTSSNPNHHGYEAYNYHLMYLTNLDAKDLRILPTHRLIQDHQPFDAKQLIKKLEDYFLIKPIANPLDINEIILGKQWCFGLVLPEQTYEIRLKPEVFHLLDWPFPEEVNKLDLTVLHYFVLEKALGIPGPEQRMADQIIYDRNFTDCITKVDHGRAQMALITNELSMQEVKRVCFSGATLPQKSTYFYPKVICGFVFGSIKEDEFDQTPDPSF
ncbi:MAG: DUF1015 domain-containing protein [Cyclobacteriaceae bacterium]